VEDAAEAGPAAAEKKKKEIEIPEFGQELLTLLEDFRQIDKDSAMRELAADSETFEKWVDELEKGDWIKVTDRGIIDNYTVEFTKKFLSTIKELKEIRKEEESLPEGEHVKRRIGLRNLLGAFIDGISSLTNKFKSNIIDLSVVLGFLTAIYLIRFFIEDPNTRILDFMASIVLFSVILFVYRNSKEKLKTKTIFQSFFAFLSILKREWKVVVFSIFIVLLIYFVGWMFIYPEIKVLSLMLCTMVLCSIIQLYHPLKPIIYMPRFYVGMVALVYALLLLLGVANISSNLFEIENRLIDLAVGVAVLALVYINRNFFNVKIAYFKRMMKQFQ